jgi:GPH family glycoside/pentoside/hexuronide:cation symporter
LTSTTPRLSTGLLVLFALPTLPMFLLRGPAFSILPALYAERFGIALTVISGVLLAVRLADGLTDLAVGWGTDATRHRWGGRKSWFLVGSLATVACIFQLYMPPAGATAFYFGLWLFIAYLAWTVNEIPYGAWAAELTNDYRERNRIAAARQYFSVTSALLIGLMPFMPFLNTQEINFELLEAVAWIVVLSLPPISLLAVWLVPRGVAVVRSGGESLRASWAAVRGNRPAWQFLGAAALAGLADACMAGLGFMVIDSYFGLKAAASIMILQWVVASMLGVWLAARLLRRFDKHRLFVAAGLLSAVMLAVNSALTPQTPHLMAMYLSLSFLLIMCSAVTEMLPQSMVGDLVDYDEWKTRAQRAGQYVALLAFVRKATFGLGSALSIFIAGSFGFEPGRPSYDTTAAMGLKLGMFWLPMGLMLAAAALMWGYPIGAQRHRAIRRRLAQRAGLPNTGRDAGLPTPGAGNT